MKLEPNSLNQLMHYQFDPDELKDKVPYALGIRNIMDKVEMKSKMEEFLATK